LPIHSEVLAAAVRLARERGSWVFTPKEVVDALPHLNPRSVRTHVVSRCCVNAPKNHPHRWRYFRRIARGRYEVLPAYRKPALRVAESRAGYNPKPRSRARDTVHAVLRQDNGLYMAECLEVAVITQGRTLDELLANLREALALHLEGEDAASLGLSQTLRLVVTYEVPFTLNGARA